MRLFGQGCPTAIHRARARTAAIVAAVGAFVIGAAAAEAAQVDVRLRFAWGSGGQSPQKWVGRITVDGATLSELQPLGIEADEAAALRLVDNEVQVAPLIRRAFDGCDVSIRGDETVIVKIELRSSPEAPSKVLEVPLGEASREPFRAPLDDLGGDLLIHRTPGDRLRVKVERPHLVFDPGETVTLPVLADLAAEAAESAITINATLHGAGSTDVLSEVEMPYDAASAAPIVISLPAPDEEGAYRITITAQRKTGLASRLVPWERHNEIATRDVEFAVVDPAARLPQLTDVWETVSTIDPTSSSWWQRVPQWTQFDKLPGFSTPRPLGNVRPAAVRDSPLALVELPSKTATADAGAGNSSREPGWQAYLLAVRHVGEPHAVEIEIPRGARQHLGVSIIEPDAAGRVTSFGRDGGVYSEETVADPSTPGVDVHRVVFWPRTKSPTLLLSNRSSNRAARYGKIRLLRRTAAPSAVEAAGEPPHRLVAAYLATPRFADALGAVEELDSQSGLSVDGWTAFLSGANRLAQQLRAGGYNAAIVCMAADGASLAPVDALGSSPRFDTGLLSSAGADPVRKDVLEVLLRVFDREGLKLIPAVQLASPLPRLETLAASSDISWRTHDGRSWAEQYPAESPTGPHYNILHDEVQAELARITESIVTRYGSHPSLAGVSFQLAGNGYGLLPGLAWGMDDATTAKFAADHGIELPGEGPTRFRQRAAVILGQHVAAWKQWRQTQLAQLYARLAQKVASTGENRQLILATEEVFNGLNGGERLRQAVGGRASLNDALDEIGLDLKQLVASPGLTVLRPRRIAAEDSVDARAIDHRINAALELDQPFASQPRAGELIFHTSSRLRLASFDAQSPYGADRTYLALSSPSFPAGDAARQPLATALAGRDFSLLAIGTDGLSLADNPVHVQALRTFQELPVAAADLRTERRQPITLRVYREADSTTVCLINESQWPVDASVAMDSSVDLVWRQLGVSPVKSAGDDATGQLPRGPQKLAVQLAPFAIHARRYSSRELRVGDFTAQVSPAALDQMARRVVEIQERMVGLSVERAYNQLQNPGFELVDDNGRLRDWQPRMGQQGAVDVAVEQQPAGRAVHLRSEDPLGVAVQSHLFSMPATGQIVVRAKVRGSDLEPGAQLYAWIEYESAGAMRQRYVALGDHTLPTTWIERELAVDDLPLAATGKMRIQFHLTGKGQAWIDNVRLYDLRFTDAQRVELSKRLLGAQAALDEGNLMDCQRLVDGYLPRRLVEHIPPPALAAKPADVTPTAAADKQEEKGLGPRIRGMVPKILR